MKSKPSGREVCAARRKMLFKAVPGRSEKVIWKNMGINKGQNRQDPDQNAQGIPAVLGQKPENFEKILDSAFFSKENGD